MSDSVRPHRWQPMRLPCAWDSPGKNTAVGCHFLLQPRQYIKEQRLYFANKGPSSQSYGFSSSHVWMLELGSKESWAPKNWCFWTVVLEKTHESPLDCKEIKPFNHLILYRPLLPASVFPSIRVFSNESALWFKWPKYWNFSFNINSSKWIFRTDFF